MKEAFTQESKLAYAFVDDTRFNKLDSVFDSMYFPTNCNV